MVQCLQWRPVSGEVCQDACHAVARMQYADTQIIKNQVAISNGTIYAMPVELTIPWPAAALRAVVWPM